MSGPCCSPRSRNMRAVGAFRQRYDQDSTALMLLAWSPVSNASSRLRTSLRSATSRLRVTGWEGRPSSRDREGERQPGAEYAQFGDRGGLCGYEIFAQPASQQVPCLRVGHDAEAHDLGPADRGQAGEI